jgi:hypothetical protein
MNYAVDLLKDEATLVKLRREWKADTVCITKMF